MNLLSKKDRDIITLNLVTMTHQRPARLTFPFPVMRIGQIHKLNRALHAHFSATPLSRQEGSFIVDD